MDRNNVFLVVPLLGYHLSLKPAQPLASCFCFPTPEGVILEEHKDSMLQEPLPAFSSAPIHPLSSPSGLSTFLILGPACTAGIYPCILRSCLGNFSIPVPSSLPTPAPKANTAYPTSYSTTTTPSKSRSESANMPTNMSSPDPRICRKGPNSG